MNSTVAGLTKVFTLCPFSRYRADDGRSAEIFRDDMIRSTMKQYRKMLVYLSSYNYYGSFFLEGFFSDVLRAGYILDKPNAKFRVFPMRLPSMVGGALTYTKIARRGE